MFKKRKKGADESNVIIFIILAIIVAGLIVYFSWKFFRTGTDLVDQNDLLTIGAIQSCQSLNPAVKSKDEAYCYTPVKIRTAKGDIMEVNCQYIEKNLKAANFSYSAGAKCNQSIFIRWRCHVLNESGVDIREINQTKINGIPCKDETPWQPLNK